MSRPELTFEALPGGDVIRRGIADLAAGRESIPSLLVSVGAPRLRELGLEIPHPFSDAEIRLYQRIASDDSDGAHARYNALIRELVSFERAAECAR